MLDLTELQLLSKLRNTTKIVDAEKGYILLHHSPDYFNSQWRVYTFQVLQSGGYITTDGDCVRLTPKGRFYLKELEVMVNDV